MGIFQGRLPIHLYGERFYCYFFGTMQQKTTKFGVVVAAISSCFHLDWDLSSSSSFSAVGV